MPAISYDGGDHSERRESAQSVMREIDDAADTLAMRTGLSHEQAVAKILSVRPGLYVRYKNAKRSDFAS